MKYVDEFRDPDVIARTSEEIRRLADPGRHYRLMEVCGGHTHAIYRFGLKDVLPANIELIHGPGCPVCVLPMGRIDDGLALAKEPLVIFTAFGDMMRVPGAHGSPLEHKAKGLDVRIVYSPTDALKLARTNPDRHVMFFAIGFETTAPSTALTLMRAKARGDQEFLGVLQSRDDRPRHPRDPRFPRHAARWLHRTGTRLDGHRLPAVRVDRARREETDRRVRLRAARSAAVDRDAAPADEGRPVGRRKSVPRVVPWEGNRAALAAMAEVFELRPYFEWRGLGFISQSALCLREGYAQWDAERVFSVAGVRVTDPKAAQCGEVLKGVLKPAQCKLFGRECTPEHPVGALMVSSEGSCAAYYNYEHRKAASSLRVLTPA